MAMGILQRVRIGLAAWACFWTLAISACATPHGTPSTGSGSRALNELFERQWEYAMREYPTWASSLGDRRYNDRWGDISLAAVQRRHGHDVEVLAEIERFNTRGLGEEDRLNLALFGREYRQSILAHTHRWYLLPVDQMWGIQTAHDLADRLPFTTAKDYQDWIGRLRTFPLQIDQTIALMREGIRTGMVPPRIIMERVPRQIENQIVQDPVQSLFYNPFRTWPAGIAQGQRQAMSGQAQEAISAGVVPAYRRLLEFFRNEYLPACKPEIGLWRLPDGKRIYAQKAQMYTTTLLTPDQIHQIGLAEVARIRIAMEGVIKEVGFKGSFDDFLEFLRADKQFYHTDPKALLAAYRAMSKEIDPRLVRLFRTMPRTPYGVEPIPDHVAPDTTTAYYVPPAADGSRAGSYFVNLYKPETRPIHEMMALSLHEAVPGHHFQISLAMELENLPKFRRHGDVTAFIEGWGLYAETLGYEMGLYDDPYQRFGQLTYEMWRAVRLVVDTGMHDQGWTRQQAIDYFLANAAKNELDIVNEVDRYIAWPGQALAYKIGQMKIRQLRDLAEKELGDRFDVRTFHDVVLLAGPLPLDALEQRVKTWIASGGGVSAR